MHCNSRSYLLRMEGILMDNDMLEVVLNAGVAVAVLILLVTVGNLIGELLL